MSGYWQAMARVQNGAGATARPRPRALFEEQATQARDGDLHFVEAERELAPPAPAPARHAAADWANDPVAPDVGPTEPPERNGHIAAAPRADNEGSASPAPVQAMAPPPVPQPVTAPQASPSEPRPPQLAPLAAPSPLTHESVRAYIVRREDAAGPAAHTDASVPAMPTAPSIDEVPARSGPAAVPLATAEPVVAQPVGGPYAAEPRDEAPVPSEPAQPSLTIDIGEIHIRIVSETAAERPAPLLRAAGVGRTASLEAFLAGEARPSP